MLLLVACSDDKIALQPTPTPVPVPAEIKNGGVLRVAVFPSNNPALAVRDPATGQLSGLSVEIGKALAADMGVRFEPVEYPSFREIQAAVNENAWDISPQGLSVAQAAGADASSPYLQVDLTYLVRADSLYRTVGDVDRAGIKVGVSRGAPSDIVLTRELKQAELVRLEANQPELVASGQIDALATGRQVLVGFVDRIPGLRILEDRFSFEENVVAVPKGRAALVAYVTSFIEQAKSSGSLKQMIDRVGVRGVQVAPATASR